MNTAASIVLIIFVFLIGNWTGYAQAYKVAFRNGVETGKVIAEWERIKSNE